MSIVGLAEDAATASTPWGWIRVGLKLLPYGVIAGLTIALLITRGTLDHVRMEAKLNVANGQRDAAEQKAGWATAGKNAADTYAKALADREPLIIRSTDTVRTYAQTAAGSAICSAPDRVSGIDALDASLWPVAPAAGRSTVGLPANASAATAGR